MRSKGFSLIELLIVVVIILVIAAIAIPSLLRARMAANEASAVGSIRLINTASNMYNSTYGNGFPPDLASIGNDGTMTASCSNAELIDPVLTSGAKSGYNFTFSHGLGANKLNKTTSSCKGNFGYSDGFMVTAIPQVVGLTGQRAFCVDASGVIRFSPNGKDKSKTPNCATTENPLQ